MSWKAYAAIAALLAIVLARLWAQRRRSFAIWQWNKAALNVCAGGRMWEVFWAETESVELRGGQLVFGQRQGAVALPGALVTPEAAQAIAGACGLRPEVILSALKA